MGTKGIRGRVAQTFKGRKTAARKAFTGAQKVEKVEKLIKTARETIRKINRRPALTAAVKRGATKRAVGKAVGMAGGAASVVSAALTGHAAGKAIKKHVGSGERKQIEEQRKQRATLHKRQVAAARKRK